MKRPLNTHKDGFTLVELLIVVAIIGIIAAIAIPNLLSAIQRGKQKRSMGDMKTVGTVIEQFNIDASSYPAAGTAVAPMVAPGDPLFGVAATQIDTNYFATPIWKDGWSNAGGSNPLYYGVYAPTTSSATDYIACSFGKSGGSTAHVVTGAVPAGCVAVTASNTGSTIRGGDGLSFNCDIAIVDGQFIQAPNGKQSNVTPCP